MLLEIMFSFDRETMTIVAVVVALAATYLLYKEVQTTKKDVKECKDFAIGMSNRLAPAPAHDVKETPAKENESD